MDAYNVLCTLGNGALGTVYLCEKKHNKQKIVIKQMPLVSDGTRLGLAINELATLKGLSHPNAIQYFDSVAKNDAIYITMEYANSGTLHKYLETHRITKLTPQTVMNFFCQMLMGLNYIHSKKLIHRDFKCDNVFLTGVKSDVVKIGDIGLSRIMQPDVHMGAVAATYNYVAPEICNGMPFSIKADIWSLGCVLYEMCELQKMFDGPLTAVILAINSSEIKQVNTEVYGIQIQQIIELMLTANPKQRPDTNALLALPDIFPTSLCLEASLGCIDQTDLYKNIYGDV